MCCQQRRHWQSSLEQELSGFPCYERRRDPFAARSTAFYRARRRRLSSHCRCVACMCCCGVDDPPTSTACADIPHNYLSIRTFPGVCHLSSILGELSHQPSLQAFRVLIRPGLALGALARFCSPVSSVVPHPRAAARASSAVLGLRSLRLRPSDSPSATCGLCAHGSPHRSTVR